MTRKELARLIGVTPQTLRYYETGRHDVPGLILDAIADLFHISVDELYVRKAV